MIHLYLDHFECSHIVICHLLVLNHTKHASHYPSGPVGWPHGSPSNVYYLPNDALTDIPVDTKGLAWPIAKDNECLVTTLDKLVGDSDRDCVLNFYAVVHISRVRNALFSLFCFPLSQIDNQGGVNLHICSGLSRKHHISLEQGDL